jgi:hypothetical protein
LTQPVFDTFRTMGLWNTWRAEPSTVTPALRTIARLALK